MEQINSVRVTLTWFLNIELFKMHKGASWKFALVFKTVSLALQKWVDQNSSFEFPEHRNQEYIM